MPTFHGLHSRDVNNLLPQQLTSSLAARFPGHVCCFGPQLCNFKCDEQLGWPFLTHGVSRPLECNSHAVESTRTVFQVNCKADHGKSEDRQSGAWKVDVQWSDTVTTYSPKTNFQLFQIDSFVFLTRIIRHRYTLMVRGLKPFSSQKYQWQHTAVSDVKRRNPMTFLFLLFWSMRHTLNQTTRTAENAKKGPFASHFSKAIDQIVKACCLLMLWSVCVDPLIVLNNCKAALLSTPSREGSFSFFAHFTSVLASRKEFFCLLRDRVNHDAERKQSCFSSLAWNINQRCVTQATVHNYCKKPGNWHWNAPQRRNSARVFLTQMGKKDNQSFSSLVSANLAQARLGSSWSQQEGGDQPGMTAVSPCCLVYLHSVSPKKTSSFILIRSYLTSNARWGKTE